MSGRINRVIVFFPNWLGDAVMALPAFDDVRRHFGRASVAVAARGPLAPLMSLVPGVDQVLPLSSDGTLSLRKGTRDARAIAAGRFDLAILFPNSFHAAWLARRAKVPERWGYRSDLRSPVLTRAVRRPIGACHQGAYYQRLVSALGMANGPLQPRLAMTEELHGRALTFLKAQGHDGSRLVGLAPGAAYGHAKRWPPALVAELISLISRETEATSLLVGSAADRQTGIEIETWLVRLDGGDDRGRHHARVLNVIGRTDLPLLAGILSWCRVFVSNDSGAMHLAAAIGLPVVGLFGPTDERATAPLPSGDGGAGSHEILTHPVWCRPCMLRECPIDHRCLTRISARTVFEAARCRFTPGGATATLASAPGQGSPPDDSWSGPAE